MSTTELALAKVRSGYPPDAEYLCADAVQRAETAHGRESAAVPAIQNGCWRSSPGAPAAAPAAAAEVSDAGTETALARVRCDLPSPG
jgi:hypothetical protein